MELDSVELMIAVEFLAQKPVSAAGTLDREWYGMWADNPR